MKIKKLIREVTLTDFKGNKHNLIDLLERKSELVLGKGKKADINLTDSLTLSQKLNYETISISNEHARIYFSEGSLVINNKQGHSNTRIRRREILHTLKGEYVLQDGDELYIGTCQIPLIFRIK